MTCHSSNARKSKLSVRTIFELYIVSHCFYLASLTCQWYLIMVWTVWIPDPTWIPLYCFVVFCILKNQMKTPTDTFWWAHLVDHQDRLRICQAEGLEIFRPLSFCTTLKTQNVYCKTTVGGGNRPPKKIAKDVTHSLWKSMHLLMVGYWTWGSHLNFTDWLPRAKHLQMEKATNKSCVHPTSITSKPLCRTCSKNRNRSNSLLSPSCRYLQEIQRANPGRSRYGLWPRHGTKAPKRPTSGPPCTTKNKEMNIRTNSSTFPFKRPTNWLTHVFYSPPNPLHSKWAGLELPSGVQLPQRILYQDFSQGS